MDCNNINRKETHNIENYDSSANLSYFHSTFQERAGDLDRNYCTILDVVLNELPIFTARFSPLRTQEIPRWQVYITKFLEKKKKHEQSEANVKIKTGLNMFNTMCLHTGKNKPNKQNSADGTLPQQF